MQVSISELLFFAALGFWNLQCDDLLEDDRVGLVCRIVVGGLLERLVVCDLDLGNRRNLETRFLVGLLRSRCGGHIRMRRRNHKGIVSPQLGHNHIDGLGGPRCSLGLKQ
jgi:hypothetical protein